MGEELRGLKEATICLSERDNDYVFDLLAEKVDRFARMVLMLDVDELIGDYLTEEDGRGVDFATYVGGVVAELEAEDDDEDDEEGSWEDEDEDDSEDGTDDELPDLF